MIHIYSIQYNKPLFIEIQKKSFDKFIKKYSFTVIDNSVEENISLEIKKICEKNNLNLIVTENKFDSRTNGLHGFSHEIGIKCFLNNLINLHNENDIVMLLDHDIFLISNIENIYDKILNSSILTIKQEREHIYYIWPGLAIFNLEKCINIRELSLDGSKLVNNVWIPIDNGVFTDVGGHSYHYLKKYSNNIIFTDITENMIQNNNNLNEKHIFYHFHDGSQWSGYSNDIWNEKLEKIKKIIN
jgi:hypothetical protein